ncbi:hypothetical protein ACETK8_20065 (plasmid) [Brevundimonas staleyi]|uniref:YubB ferredoxin-like domain-containing protein n=1 Tax=Brevundimonas staleyi TaxID=74326 RepID=A0ABW0FN13_9CAUL
MGNRVSARITIGGRVPADQVDNLCEAIEDEALGPSWDEGFDSREALLAHLRAGKDGADLYANEVNGGEFDILQAFCAAQGLVYQLTYDGYPGEWGPATRLRHADGTEESCALDSDGDAVIGRFELTVQGFASVDEIHAYLERFERFRPGRLILGDEHGAGDGGGAP